MKQNPRFLLALSASLMKVLPDTVTRVIMRLPSVAPLLMRRTARVTLVATIFITAFVMALLQQQQQQYHRQIVSSATSPPLMALQQHLNATLQSFKFHRHKKSETVRPGVDNGSVSRTISFDEKATLQNRNRLRMEAMFESRRETLVRTCYKYYNYGPNVTYVPYREVSYRFLFVDDVNKILFCSVPKVGSTNWKRAFMLLNGVSPHNNNSVSSSSIKGEDNGDEDDDDDEDDDTSAVAISQDAVHEGNATWPYIKPLKSFTANEVHERLQNYTRIMFVRDPLKRLLSAWKSKFVTRNDFYAQVYGRHIIQKYRPGASKEEIQIGFPVSLKEFFYYLRDEGIIRGDVHWTHYHTHWYTHVYFALTMYLTLLCVLISLACIIPYDYIGHLENVNNEANYIIRAITGRNDFNFPQMSSPGDLRQKRQPPMKQRQTDHSKPSRDYDEFLTLIKELPLDLLQYIVLEYRLDYEMFGYPIPNFFD